MKILNTLESYKSFENLFFDEKDDLLSRLDNFLKNETLYQKTGMPYTFGLIKLLNSQECQFRT